MVLVRVELEDLNELQDICIRAYAGNFSDHWVENGLELFLEDEFSKGKLAKDLSEEVFTYYFISVEGEIRGFLKVDYNLPIGEYPKKSSELVKIYHNIKEYTLLYRWVVNFITVRGIFGFKS